jgi:hypothetical protein
MNEEILISIDEVPPVALVAAQQAALGVELTEAGVDVDEAGVGVYEISGEGIEIDVTPLGVIVEIEEEISNEDVPGDVLEALERRVPGLSVTLIEKSLRKSVQVFYEFSGETEDGNVLDVEISEDGGQVLIQEDAAG